MDKLAIFGGDPVRRKPLYYGKQWIDEKDIEAVSEVLKSDFLTGGPWIKELEEKLCDLTKAPYAVAVSNGTAALHIAVLAAGIGEGDEVITTPITFAASANSILYAGATPVFADIDPETYNIDPIEIEKKITPKTKAVIAVDFTGQAANYTKIKEITKKYGLLLIEDAAHSIGTIYKNEPIGSIADITTFSFHPVKTVTSGEGGAVTTADPEIYKKLLLLRSHGITRNRDEMLHPTTDPWFNEQVLLGFNYRMTDIQAALLISQLHKLEKFSAIRNEIKSFYDKIFSETEGLILQKEEEGSITTRHLYILKLDPGILSCSRREFFDAISAENVNGQIHYLPVYLHGYYQKLGYCRGLCPNAEDFYEHCISIPFYPAMTQTDKEDTVKAIQKVVEFYKR